MKKQFSFFSKSKTSYGGELRNKRKGRVGARSLSTKNCIHLVLRSSKAKGHWSFIKHNQAIRNLIHKFAVKNGIQVVALANVGNHLHLQIKLTKMHLFKPFIRAVTAAIAMKVTNTNRWTKIKSSSPLNFWDQRPFTRVIQSFQEFLNLSNYIRMNTFEGQGFDRDTARAIVRDELRFLT